MKLIKLLVLVSSIGLAITYILFTTGTFKSVQFLNSNIQLSPNVGGVNLQQRDTIRNDSLKFVSEEIGYLDGLIYFDSLGNRYYDKRAWRVRMSTSKSLILADQVEVYLVNDSVYYKMKEMSPKEYEEKLLEELQRRARVKDSTDQKK